MFDAYPRYEYLLASLQLAFAMLGMGALLGPRDFARVVRSPRGLAVGLAVQLLLVPLIAGAVGRALPVPAGIAAGLALVASVPGGTMSNVLTYFAYGNIALSITLTTVTTLAALATTPILLRLLVQQHLPPDFAMPVTRIAFEIGVTLLVPLFTGMAVGSRLGAHRERFARLCVRISLGVIGLMIVGAAGSGRLDAMAYGWLGPAAIFLLCGLFLAVAIVASRAGRLLAPDRLAVVIEATVRNTNLAVMIKASVIPATDLAHAAVGDGMFFVALLYGGAAIPFAGLLVGLGRRGVVP